ncbi:putative DNA primase/helicase [Gammaproteobacteria bacterium]
MFNNEIVREPCQIHGLVKEQNEVRQNLASCDNNFASLDTIGKQSMVNIEQSREKVNSSFQIKTEGSNALEAFKEEKQIVTEEIKDRANVDLALPRSFPQQLEDFNAFVKLQHKSKIPIAGHSWKDKPAPLEEIKAHIATGGNYGVLTGVNGLVVVDFDDMGLGHEALKIFPATHTVKTFKGYHFYYRCDEIKNKVSIDHHGKHLDIQAGNSYVVGAGSTHEKGTIYTVISNCETASITAGELSDYLRQLGIEWVLPRDKGDTKSCDTGQDDNYKQYPNGTIYSVLTKWAEHNNKTLDLTQADDEWRGTHPVHGSANGNNFFINIQKNVWHCFRCNTGGGVISFIAILEGVITCEEAIKGGLRGQKFIDVQKIAQEVYGIVCNQPAKRENAAIPRCYRVDDDGVFFECVTPKGITYEISVCSKIDVVACTRDNSSINHGRLLQFKDPDGKQHEWAMPMEALAGDGTDYRRSLLNMGVIISPNKKAREALTGYLSGCQPQDKALCVERIGWHNKTFVFPDEVIGEAEGEKIIFQSMTYNIEGFKTNGTTKEWQENISKYCIGNSRLILAVSAAFAAPLLNLLHEESGGLHFYGASSIGKTAALKVACSVWGDRKRLQTWRATSNGLEGVAALHNDSLLCLDEMSQVDPKEAGEIAYMLANGAGKNRSKKDGTSRKKASWGLLFFSSGEVGLAEHISQIGKKAKAGQEVRLLNIPADAGQNLGIFENLYGFNNGSDFARHLNQATETYYGTPIREFLKQITRRDVDELIKSLENLREDFIKELSIKTADGQVKRAANRFSLIASAGELASSFGITGWKYGEAIQAAKRCFQDWLSNRGGSISQEELQMISQVKGFFQKNHPARFINWDNHLDSRVTNKAGFYKTNGISTTNGETNKLDFFVETEIFKNEICIGLNIQLAAKVCIDKGWLIPDKAGSKRPTQSMYAPDTQKSRRFYCFSSKVLGGEYEE